MIDLERYNTCSPYVATKGQEEGFYEFHTDFGVHYSVGFQYDDLSLQRHPVYQFFIININHKASPNDRKVRKEITLMLDEFFRQNNEVVLYICETSDGKQAMRNKLFQQWFSRDEQKGGISYYSSTVKDDEGIVNYATIILRNDNPKMAEVVQDFTETIQLLNSKP